MSSTAMRLLSSVFIALPSEQPLEPGQEPLPQARLTGGDFRQGRPADADLQHPARVVLVLDLAFLVAGHDLRPALDVLGIGPDLIDRRGDQDVLFGLDHAANSSALVNASSSRVLG